MPHAIVNPMPHSHRHNTEHCTLHAARCRKAAGFTLIELLTIIALAGILIVSIFAGSRSFQARARDASQKDDLERIKTSLYEYNFDSGCFPTELPSCGEAFGYSDVTYLANMPCKRDGAPYAYEVPESSCPSSFKLLTNLEVTTDTSIDQVGCRFGCGDECNYNYGLASTNVRIEEGCVLYFVCAPGGACEDFEDPERSKCPVVFENDPQCGGVDCNDKDYRCQNSSGKLVPDE